MAYDEDLINPKVAEAMLAEPVVVDLQRAGRNKYEYKITVGPYLIAAGKGKRNRVFDEIEDVYRETRAYLESLSN